MTRNRQSFRHPKVRPNYLHMSVGVGAAAIMFFIYFRDLRISKITGRRQYAWAKTLHNGRGNCYLNDAKEIFHANSSFYDPIESYNEKDLQVAREVMC